MADAVLTQIERARTKAGLSKNALAELSGVPIRSLHRVLGGQVDPSDQTLSDLARALGVTLTRPAVRFNPDGSIQ